MERESKLASKHPDDFVISGTLCDFVTKEGGVCGREYQYLSSLKKHLRNHHRLNSQEIEKMISSQKDKNHMVQERFSKKTGCPVSSCRLQFSIQDTMVEHLMIRHNFTKDDADEMLSQMRQNDETEKTDVVGVENLKTGSNVEEGHTEDVNETEDENEDEIEDTLDMEGVCGQEEENINVGEEDDVDPSKVLEPAENGAPHEQSVDGGDVILRRGKDLYEDFVMVLLYISR